MRQAVTRENYSLHIVKCNAINAGRRWNSMAAVMEKKTKIEDEPKREKRSR